MMNCKIVTPEKLVLEGAADLIIGPGSLGELGVLPSHAPLLSTLKEGRLRIKQGNHYREFDVSDGFIEVLPDKVTILTNKAAEIKESA